MKISNTLTLSLLLVSLLALAVASRISQMTNTISVEEKQDCTIRYYNQTEDLYGYATKERNAYGNCLYYHNYTGCLNTSGPNTDCSLRQSTFNFTCITGTESYQNYEKVGIVDVLKNKTECITSKFIVSINKGSVTEKKEVDFSSWGVCINSTENGCLAITCGTLKGGSARNGIFNGCDGGKSCQKFLFCQHSIKILQKASRDNFVENDPTYHLPKSALKGVGQ